MTARSSQEAITRDELVAAFIERLRRCSGTRQIESGEQDAAEEIFEIALSLREPEYEPGEIYRDALGQPFYRCPSGRWLWLPEGASFSDHTPNRPLRRLVPET